MAGTQCPRHPEVRISQRTRISQGPPDIAGYRVGECLGEGGFAAVWSALRDEDYQPVAIKVGHVSTGKLRRRFQREADALRQVGPPHVPEVHDNGELPDGRPYLIMELLQGAPLANHLGNLAKPPDASWVQKVGDAILNGLEAVHRAGLVHGDLKPDNVFLDFDKDERPIARLLDFGIVRSATTEHEDELDQEHTKEEVVGSAEYMAPEQFDGHAEPSADIYAAGVLLYELLTLRVPFVGDLASIRHGHQSLRPPRPSLFAPVAEPLDALCLACMSKEPQRRPADVAELRKRLQQVAREASTLSPSPPKPTGKGGKKRLRSSSVLADARQPVVLLAADVTGAGRAVVFAVERNKGVVSRQRGRRYICGFSALRDEEPVQAAIDTADELVSEYDAKVVLHIAQLKVRRSRRGQALRFYGAALEDLKSWMPREDWHGVLVTEKLASAMPPERLVPAGQPGFYRLGDGSPLTIGPETDPSLVNMSLEPSSVVNMIVEPSFVGREAEMRAARKSFQAVIDNTNPGLLTVLAESGLGKTRLAAELGSVVRRVDPDAVVLATRAHRQVLGKPHQTLRRLLKLLSPYTEIDIPPADEEIDVAAGARQLGDALRKAASERPIVLVVDDVHFADGATLDAIEYATLDGEGVRLWVAAIGHPHLHRRRPQWGERAHSHTYVELEPLSEDAAMKLASEFLRPAEYPPEDALRRLARWTGGNPHFLEGLVRTLKREGIVRKRPNSDSWYVATAELDRLPASPADQWLAMRQLDRLPAQLAACLRLCAVLGVEFLRDELEWVQNAADRGGTATSFLDTDVGLAEIKRLGFASGRDGVWSFRQAALQDAIYKLVGERERKLIHGYALEYWHTQTGENVADRVLAALARHAGACDARKEAADAYLELGDRAFHRHVAVDADQHYTAALGFIDENDHARRIRALGGRGRVLYRIQRTGESIADLKAAQQHAKTISDTDKLAELLLEEAIALDWEERFRDSAARVEEAAPLVDLSNDPRLKAMHCLGVGRNHIRIPRIPEAIEYLSRANDSARACGADETRIIALLLLGVALAFANRKDEATARFNEVIALCKQTGDLMHLCVAYGNSGLVWLEENAIYEGTQNLRRAVRLARQVGQPTIERNCTYNLAELLHCSGKRAEALSLAKRVESLQRFLSTPDHEDALLRVRIHLAWDEYKEAYSMAERVRQIVAPTALSVFERAILTMMDMIVGERDDEPDLQAWDVLTAEAREEVPRAYFLEILHLRGRVALHAGRWEELDRVLEEADTLLAANPVWRYFFDRLREQADLHS